MNTFGHVGIDPIGALPETAALLGEVLGGLVFVEDTLRRYDEFPAFVAESGGLRFALLGVPDPADDLRDEPTNDFELMIEPVVVALGDAKTDISDQVMQRLRNDGRINCWSLK
jgi:hypothetical protein